MKSTEEQIQKFIYRQLAAECIQLQSAVRNAARILVATKQSWRSGGYAEYMAVHAGAYSAQGFFTRCRETLDAADYQTVLFQARRYFQDARRLDAQLAAMKEAA